MVSLQWQRSRARKRLVLQRKHPQPHLGQGYLLVGRRNGGIRRAFRCTEPMVSDNQAFRSAVGATSCETARLFDRAVFRNILDGVDLVRAVANTDGDSDFFEQSKLKVVNGVCLCGFILSMHMSPSDSGARRHRASHFALLRRLRPHLAFTTRFYLKRRVRADEYELTQAPRAYRRVAWPTLGSSVPPACRGCKSAEAVFSKVRWSGNTS